MARRTAYRLSALAVPVAVWALHFTTLYSLAGLACSNDWARSRWGGMEAVGWLMLGVTVAAWAVLFLFGRKAWSAWRAQPAPDDASGHQQLRRRFLSRVTLVLCGAAALAVTFTVIPIFLLPTCAG